MKGYCAWNEFFTRADEYGISCNMSLTVSNTDLEKRRYNWKPIADIYWVSQKTV